MNKKKLMLEQIEKKLIPFKNTENVIIPEKGWINSLRSVLNITLKQLGERLNTSPQNIRAMEEREASGSITLNSLTEIARVMEMKLVYALVPIDQSLESLIEKRALQLAKKIVYRTSGSMKLEDQENSAYRIEKAVQEKVYELKKDLPKYLWD